MYHPYVSLSICWIVEWGWVHTLFFLGISQEVQARVEAVRDSLKLETGQLFGLTLELDNKLENLMSESGQDVEAVNERVKELDEDVEFLNLELARCIEELDTKFENSKALSQEEHEVGICSDCLLSSVCCHRQLGVTPCWSFRVHTRS